MRRSRRRASRAGFVSNQERCHVACSRFRVRHLDHCAAGRRRAWSAGRFDPPRQRSLAVALAKMAAAAGDNPSLATTATLLALPAVVGAKVPPDPVFAAIASVRAARAEIRRSLDLDAPERIEAAITAEMALLRKC